MPPPNPPRRRPADDDDDFEVVDEAPAKPARPLPPLPGQPAAAPQPAPRPTAKAAAPAPKPASKPPQPAPKPALPAAKPAPKPAPKPAFEVVDDTEVEVVSKAKTAQTRKPPPDDDDDRPRRRRDEDDDDRPRKKKGKKKGDRAKTGDEYADEVRERRLKEFEVIWPTVFLLLGMGMAITGAIGAGGPTGVLSVLLMIGGLFISIPISIVTLMVVGAVCGINYGRFGPAVLKIAAVTFVVNGIYFIAEWLKIPPYFAGPVGCGAAFGMFKTMFDLDNGETNTSMGAINVVSFLLKWAIIVLVAVIVSKSGRDPDGDGGSGPSENRGGWKAPPATFPGDEPDDPDDDP